MASGNFFNTNGNISSTIASNTNNNNNNTFNFFNTNSNNNNNNNTTNTNANIIFGNTFNLGNKPEEDIPGELPLLQLQSKFSITSQMNPVRGLEMKRMISLNQEGAAEPYIDLNSNIIYNPYNNNTNQQQQQQQQPPPPPQLVLQPSFMLELNGHTTSNNQNSSAVSAQQGFNYYSNFDVLAQSQQQQIHNNHSSMLVNNTINNTNNNTSNTAIQPNFFGNLFPNGSSSQASTNASSNLIFKNPDLLSSSVSLPIKNTLTYQTAQTGFQPAIKQQQQQQQHQQSQFSFINHSQQQPQPQPNMFPMFKEKKEEFDAEQAAVLHSFTNNSTNQSVPSQQQFYSFQATSQQQQQQQYNPNSNNNNNGMNFPQQSQQQFQQLSQQYQQQQLQQQLQQHFALNQAPQPQLPLHQQFMNMDEAEYLDGARSQAGAGAEDEQDDFGQLPDGLGGLHSNNNHNFHRINHNNNNHIQHDNQHNHHNHHVLHNTINGTNNNNLHDPQHGQQNDSNDEPYEEGYTNNESHTRHKTEWPTRPKGQIKYQQCRHRNIFKNFGNIFRKFVSFHPHFTEKVLEGLQKNQEHLKLFMKWLKKDIRLENKKDFIEGWTVWKDEEALTRQFKIILKELSKDFFEDYILIYLLNSKLQDLEIHLRSIGPCLAAINQPTVLYKFRPI